MFPAAAGECGQLHFPDNRADARLRRGLYSTARIFSGNDQTVAMTTPPSTVQ